MDRSIDDGTRTDAGGPRNQPRQVLAAGEQIGRYEVIESLGAGGMGVVYRAHDPDLTRDVAIKVLQTAAPGTPPADSHEKRLLREAQAMARLKHPNIATVYDVGTHKGRVFIAMEFVDGTTLKGWLRERERPWTEKLEALLAAGRGLAAAHEAGVVHRDFKPDNVLVSRDGQVQVVDFGLARSLAKDEVDHDAEGRLALPAPETDARDLQLTRTGAVVGTPAYMSPEQFLGREVDARSDQFSFAVVVFEALWGTRPFPGVTAREVMGAVARGASVRAPGGDLPRAFVDVVGRGLSPAPIERYPTMDDFLAALERAAGGRRGPRRTAIWVAAALSVAALGLGITTYAVTQDDGDSAAPAREEIIVTPQPPASPGPDLENGIGRAIEVFREEGEEGSFAEALKAEIGADVSQEVIRELEKELRAAEREAADGNEIDARIRRMVIERIIRSVREHGPE